ncbi:hypothetical protein STSP2_00756 [Anaerohalosphaera lusitana]|uniref:PEP-CTERM protein-sorting domain-containing protein n=1 Tax=Anaerohalosphaera lusitana TaxID=1936003 RepID=A0A1U9NIN8_9BACT|nr:hypothetical protein [Anaerohalosphaera lusitana]AQT67608.1 hypothetical protein STSP2_00756 [Anaerohalosphaera lusitana]
MKHLLLLSLAVLLLPGAALAGTVLNTNLLVNPGFEDSLNGWVSNGGDNRSNDPAPHSGSSYVFFPSTSTGAVSQTVDLDLGTFTEGDYEANYGGWQARWHGQADAGKITLYFLDQTGAALGSDSLGFHSPVPWELQEGTAVLPGGTEQIIYEFYGVRYEGSNLDSYLDDAFLSISVVPEPATLVILAAGAVICTRKPRR